MCSFHPSYTETSCLDYYCRNVLQKACELNLSTVALCVINSVRRNFPPDEGAHIALRTYSTSVRYIMNIVCADYCVLGCNTM